MLLVKTSHMVLAALSLAGFALRGWWMLRGSRLLARRVVRVAPHVVDTALLATGLTLAIGWQISPLDQPWFAAKLLALLVYVVSGSIALRRGRTPGARGVALGVAVIAAGYIVLAAVRKSALPFF